MLKKITILALLIWQSYGFAQSSLPLCDTCRQDYKKAQFKNADSLLQMQKQSVQGKKDTLLIQGKEKATDFRDKQKDKFNTKTDSQARAGYKAKLAGKVDSSARADARSKVKGSMTEQMAKARSRPADKWKQLKTKLPERKNIIKFSGEIRSESFYATAQNPMMRNEPMYSRLYISPTITLFGLPFKSNFFFTTESNNAWKSNFFSIRFDVNAMRRQAMADMQQELDEAKKLDRLRQVDLQKNILETRNYEHELENMKSQVPDLDALQATLKEKAEEKSKAFVEAEKARLENKLKHASEEEKLKLENEFKHKQDSVINHYKQQAGDSVLNAKGKVMSEADTSKMGKYLRMKQKLDDLKAKKQQLENLRQADSAQLTRKVSGMRNPDDIRKMAKDQLPDKKILNEILAVDRFGIGLVNPLYSEFTLFAASLKGVDIGMNKDNYFYDLTLGKTTRQFTGPFSAVKPSYDRMLGVARLGVGELKGDHLAVEYLYAYDPKMTDADVPMVRNGVVNLTGQFTMLKNTKLEANLAQSTYKEKYVLERSNYAASNVVLDASANRAYQVKLTQSAGENVKVEAHLKQTGAAFRTLGNPFLRRNFREAELKYEQQLFKKKIKVSGFYKEMRDNIVELNSATNRLKGYGLKLSTAFEKYPNLSLGYSPYQQGNNHPDSAYRTNNQFSITTAMLTYKKRFIGISWNGLVNYTRSAMELNERGTVAYRLVSTVHTLQIGQRHTSIFSYMSNVTAPFVDSLNSNSIQLNHTYMAKKSLSFGLIAEHTVYKNNAYRTGAGLQISSTVLKNFTIILLTRYDKINKLWQLDNADVFTGKLVLVWRW